ncbi:MAG: glycosyltransferase [Deltaproteobacteria bacterium]|nr:glycosyltransferase [Deltaproteobacteria bacterium]
MGKIAVFCDEYLPGELEYLHDDLRRLEEFKLDIYTRKFNSAFKFYRPGINIYENQHYGAVLSSQLQTATGFALERFLEINSREKYDFILALSGMSGVFASSISSEIQARLVVFFHEDDVASFFVSPRNYSPLWEDYRLSRFELFNETDLALVQNEELAQLLQEAGLNEKKIKIYHSGIDTEFFDIEKSKFQGFSGENNAPMVAMQGNTKPKYGLYYGIKAFMKMKEEVDSVKLLIISSEKNTSRLKSMVNKAGLKEDYIISRAENNQEVIDLLAGSTIAVVPGVISIHFQRNVATRFAMAAAALGLPLVGTYHGGIPSIIEDGVNGYLVPERNTALLADRMAALLKNKDNIYVMGKNSRAKMEFEFGIERSTRLLIHYFNLFLSPQ